MSMISIIIVHYHVRREVLKAIRSIVASKSKTVYEIIVVDNDEEKTLKKELQQQFPKVKYVPNHNKGFGQGNNVGAKHAKGKYLFFLNPDTEISPHCLDLLINYLEKYKGVGIAAPLLYNTEKKIVPLQGARLLTPLRAIFCFSFLSKLFPNNQIAKHYWLKDVWDKKSIQEVGSVPGTAFIIRRDVFQKIKGFDERFFLFFEEHDLCKRVAEVGWKIVMMPQAKVMHRLGSSTKQSKNIQEIFQQSRFYYLKKHFGIIAALLAEAILRISKYTVLLTIILLIGIFLRLQNIGNGMVFIGDQGWFYLSARDMLLTGHVPLVGIASSHPWLHQGALWTYLLAFSFQILGFNPLSGAYLSVLLDVFAILFIYKLGTLLFSKRLGMIAAVLYATSSLVVFNARMPYHTSPIPLFTMFFLYSLYKWMQGSKYYFPLIIFFLGILYNLEIATVLLSFVFLGVWLYGIVTKQSFAKTIFIKKIIVLSLCAFIVSMFSMLLHDVSHGFPQTLGFVTWLGYKVLVTLGYQQIHPTTPVAWSEMFVFFAEQVRKLIFAYNWLVALGIFVICFVSLVLSFPRRSKFSMTIVLIVNLLLLIGFFASRTPSHAYLPMMFPGLLLLIAILFDGILGNKIRLIRGIGIIGLIVIICANVYYSIEKNTSESSFRERLTVAIYIVKEAGKKEYTIKGAGENSQFASFTMNYEYLTWWLGHGSSKRQEMLQFIIKEDDRGISVIKNSKHL